MNVRTLCLGFLSTQEATGYEIKKEFEEGLFSHFIEASYGSIYPALNQLAADGLVTVREEEQSGKPDKKVYAITTAGHAALSKWLSVVPARDKYKSEFLFEMYLQHYLTAGHTVVAIEKQLSHLRDDLKCIDQCRAEGNSDEGATFIMGYGEAVLTASVSYLESKLVEMKSRAAKAAE
ncbi:MAG: PadR family transcriptional regulator [Proteobacteria bacterium]|nr:PadR family transcriptional regulator [Pseudomonadota bacterium]